MRRGNSSPELSLTDHLAIDRTVLANERTALAYGRTVLAMLVIGGTCIKFFDAWYMWAIGAVFIAGSLAVAAFGWHRFRRTQRFLAAALQKQTGEPDHPLREKVEESAPTGETRPGAATAQQRAPR
jgi:putative membrane protein